MKRSNFSKRIIAFTVTLAMVFAVFMPFSVVQAGTFVNWSLNDMLAGREPGSSFSSNSEIHDAGIPSGVTVNSHGGNLGFRIVRTEPWHGIDIRAGATNMQAGDTITVTGRSDGAAPADAQIQLARNPGHIGLASAVIENGSFSVSHTLSAEDANGLSAVRINTTDASGAINFFIDTIVITRDDTAPTPTPPADPTPIPTPHANPQGVRQTITRNLNQRINNWDVEAWTQSVAEGAPQGMGGIEMIVYNDGSFSCSWDRTFNTLFRTGRKFPRNTRASSVGDISLMYNAPEFTSNGTSYLSVYGWFRNPLVEWYVMDDFNRSHYRPGGPRPGEVRTGYQFHGTIEVDGGIYDIYTGLRVNQPSIDGSRTFLQVFSIRHTARTSGTIDVSAHFEAWNNIGEVTHTRDGVTHTARLSNTSDLTEVSFKVEGFGTQRLSSGSATVSQLCIRYGRNRLCTLSGCSNCTVGIATPTPAPTATPTPTATPEPTPTPAPSPTPSAPEVHIMRFSVGATHYTNRGVTLNLDAAPYIDPVSARTMVPFRAIAEGLGATVGWNDATRTVNFVRDGNSASLTIDVPLPDNMGTPVIVDGRTFVPARFVSEVLGSEVRWDNTHRAVYIY